MGDSDREREALAAASDLAAPAAQQMRQMRQMRLEAQRHAVMIASAVAHDVNNPIAFLSLASAELRRMVERATRGADAPPGEGAPPNVHFDMARLSELVREIEESAARLGRIVHELRIFTRGADAARGTGGVVELGRLVDGALTLAAGQLGGRARIEAPRTDAESYAPAPVSFGYALLNVLLFIGGALADVAEASPEVGDDFLPLVQIEIVTGGETPEPENAASDRDLLAVVVRVRSAALVRFVAREKATPLALDLARDVLADAGGALETLASENEQIYKMTVPSVASSSSVRPEPASASASASKASARLASAAAAAMVTKVASAGTADEVRHRVLVVDDEVALARALARGLSATYDVDVAFTAADALTYLLSTRYDAIVCDLHLPERSGTAIHDQVARVSFDQARRFIFTTGASGAGDATLARALASGCSILEKPFDGRTLEAEVARVAVL